jgi:hypothetical protein
MAPKSLECQLKVKGFKMNERIRELAEQAGMTDDKFGMFFAKDKHDEDDVDLEKFAELIVRECVDIVSKVPNGYRDYRNQIEEAMRGDCLQAIQEHFGVE